MSSTMTRTAEISIDAITVSELNPRIDIDEAALAELTQSVKSLGVINPITVREYDADRGTYILIAGQRRLWAAEAAGLTTIPAVIRSSGSEEQDEGVAVAENVIRADLTPLEEANAYQLLADQHGGVEQVATLVGRSVETVTERLRLLALPSTTQQLIAERKITLACAPMLTTIAEKSPALCDAVADLLVNGDETDQRDFPDDPGSLVDAVLAEQVLAWSAGGWSDPIAPKGPGHLIDTGSLFSWLAPHTKTPEAWAKLPPLASPDDGAYDYRVAEEHRRRARLLKLEEEDIIQARAYGCLIELPSTGYHADVRYYVTDPEWIDEFIAPRVLAHEPAEDAPERPSTYPRDGGVEGSDEARKQQKAAEREAAYAERVEARSRNLDVGAAMQKYSPELNVDEVKLLAAIALHHYGAEAAYAYRLCEDQPVKTSKAGKEAVQYPRGGDAVNAALADAWGALDRAKTPKEAAGVALRLLVAHHLVDTSGLPHAETMGMQEAYELREQERYEMGSGKKVALRTGKLLDKLATRLAPASVKKHLRAKATADALAKKATAADDE